MTDPLKDINAKHVTVIVTFLITTAGLVALGKDVAAFVVVGLAILGGIGVVISKQAETKQETQVIREQTNGTQTAMVNHLVELTRESQATNRELMAILERFGTSLAASTPPDVAGALVAELPAAGASASNGNGVTSNTTLGTEVVSNELSVIPLGFALSH